VDIREPLDDHLLACVDRQLEFSDLIGGAGYSVDLQENSVSFVGRRELRVGLIGSAAPRPGTWLWEWASEWAWANPTSYPAPAKGASVSDTRCSRSGSTCI
jgi:hypothetical protein